MAAKIVKLPTVRVERTAAIEAVTIAVTVLPRTYKRIADRARQWDLEPAEAAAMILSDAVAPKPRRR
jgi:hypothetical protein